MCSSTDFSSPGLQTAPGTGNCGNMGWTGGTKGAGSAPEPLALPIQVARSSTWLNEIKGLPGESGMQRIQNGVFRVSAPKKNRQEFRNDAAYVIIYRYTVHIYAKVIKVTCMYHIYFFYHIYYIYHIYFYLPVPYLPCIYMSISSSPEHPTWRGSGGQSHVATRRFRQGLQDGLGGPRISKCLQNAHALIYVTQISSYIIYDYCIWHLMISYVYVYCMEGAKQNLQSSILPSVLKEI